MLSCYSSKACCSTGSNHVSMYKCTLYCHFFAYSGMAQHISFRLRQFFCVVRVVFFWWLPVDAYEPHLPGFEISFLILGHLPCLFSQCFYQSVLYFMFVDVQGDIRPKKHRRQLFLIFVSMSDNLDLSRF